MRNVQLLRDIRGDFSPYGGPRSGLRNVSHEADVARLASYETELLWDDAPRMQDFCPQCGENNFLAQTPQGILCSPCYFNLLRVEIAALSDEQFEARLVGHEREAHTTRRRDASKREVAALFADRRRRDGRSAFEAHLAPVAQMVAQTGGDDLTVATAYWHDVFEDVSVPRADLVAMMDAIDERIAPAVAVLSEDRTTSDWQARKESYLAHIPSYGWRELLVSLCDKIVTGHDFVDEWGRGEFSRHDMLWFYDAAFEAYEARAEAFPQYEFFRRVLGQLDGIILKLYSIKARAGA